MARSGGFQTNSVESRYRDYISDHGTRYANSTSGVYFGVVENRGVGCMMGCIVNVHVQLRMLFSVFRWLVNRLLSNF